MQAHKRRISSVEVSCAKPFGQHQKTSVLEVKVNMKSLYLWKAFNFFSVLLKLLSLQYPSISLERKCILQFPNTTSSRK